MMNENLRGALEVLRQSEAEYKAIVEHPGLYPSVSQIAQARDQVYFAKDLVWRWLKKVGTYEDCCEIFELNGNK